MLLLAYANTSPSTSATTTHPAEPQREQRRLADGAQQQKAFRRGAAGDLESSHNNMAVSKGHGEEPTVGPIGNRRDGAADAPLRG